MIGDDHRHRATLDGLADDGYVDRTGWTVATDREQIAGFSPSAGNDETYGVGYRLAARYAHGLATLVDAIAEAGAQN